MKLCITTRVFLFLITFTQILYGAQSQLPNLHANNFNQLIEYIVTKYENQKINTGWHYELLNDYCKCTGCQRKDPLTLSSYELLALGMQRQYIDQMAIEYAKLKDNTFIVFLFPPASLQAQAAIGVLKDFGVVVYEKPVHFNANGVKYFLKSVYDVHHADGWIPTYEGIFARFRNIMNQQQAQRVHTILWECQSLEKAIQCKRVIRAIYGSNDICHFNDRHHETVHNAQNMFNQCTIDFFNYSCPKNFGDFVHFVKQMRQYLKIVPSFYDCYCIDTGCALAAYGIRPCGDLDLIFKGDFNLPFENLGWNNFTREKYGFNCDDLIYNPRNHFYHKGLRFLTVENIRNFKEKKANPKDKADVKLIDEYLKRKSENLVKQPQK